MNAKLLWRLIVASAAITAAILCLCALAGCAVAPILDANGVTHGYVMGVAVDGGGPTAGVLGTAATVAATFLGMPPPVAAAVGTGVTGLLTAWGVGAHQRRVGERKGWDEHRLEAGQ